jgi:hypothetical protein
MTTDKSGWGKLLRILARAGPKAGCNAFVPRRHTQRQQQRVDEAGRASILLVKSILVRVLNGTTAGVDPGTGQ